MQTHKNAKLRDNVIVAPAPPVAPKPKIGLTGSSAAGTTRSPRFELEGKKWMIECQRNNQNLTVKNADMSQSVYIYQCEHSAVKEPIL